MEFKSTRKSVLLQLFCLSTILGISERGCAQTPAHATDNQYLRGYLQSPSGNETCNPCVEDVIHAVTTLRDRGETLGFNWGDEHPVVLGAGTKNHWQGIQRLQCRTLMSLTLLFPRPIVLLCRRRMASRRFRLRRGLPWSRWRRVVATALGSDPIVSPLEG